MLAAAPRRNYARVGVQALLFAIPEFDRAKISIPIRWMALSTLALCRFFCPFGRDRYQAMLKHVVRTDLNIGPGVDCFPWVPSHFDSHRHARQSDLEPTNAAAGRATRDLIDSRIL